MDNYKKKEILRAMIETEKNVAALYTLFAARFKEDREFWKTISLEEEQHAAMLGSGVLHLALQILPDVVLLDKLPELRLTNESIKKIIEVYAKKLPPKEEAYNFAIQMEKSLSEAFFQELLRMKDAPELVALWQKLGAETVEHSKKIRSLLPVRRAHDEI